MSVLADESVASCRFCVFEVRVLLVRRVGRVRGSLGIMPGQRTRPYFRAPTRAIDAAAMLAVAVENRAFGGPRRARDLKRGIGQVTTVLDDDTRARLAGSFSCGVPGPRIHADRALRASP